MNLKHVWHVWDILALSISWFLITLQFDEPYTFLGFLSILQNRKKKFQANFVYFLNNNMFVASICFMLYYNS